MKKITLISLFCLFQLANISAQTVSSEKVTIHVKHQPLPKVIEQGKIMTQPGNNDIYGKYYALVIGVSNFTTISKTDKSLRDAEKFYNIITTRYTFEKDNVSFLRDATIAEIKEALDSFSKKVGAADNFLIFYSGQGFWDAASEAGFWLPSDAKGTGFWLVPTDEKESVRLGWLSNRMLSDWLRKINSKHTLLITNACFGGPLFNARSVSGDPTIPVNKLNELKGRKAITGGMLSNVAGQGDFFSYLSDNLEKNSEKYLPSEKFFNSFSKQVSNSTKIISQFGEINNLGDEGGDFIFILRD